MQRWGQTATGFVEDAIVLSAANAIANQPPSIRKDEEPAVKVAAMDVHDTTLALLGARAPEATVCPSEVARALAASAGAGRGALDWRGNMPAVHAAIDRLVIEGRVRLSWKGRILPERTGPYRIGRGNYD